MSAPHSFNKRALRSSEHVALWELNRSEICLNPLKSIIKSCKYTHAI